MEKSIDTNVSGMMPNGDPAPKRNPNDGGKKTAVAIGVSSVGTAVGTLNSVGEGTQLPVEIPKKSSNQGEIKEQPKDYGWWQLILDIFK